MTVARATKNIGFTVPPGMADEFESVAVEEGSTKSELFRRMFRVYRMYRKELAKAEEERIAKIVADVLEDAKRPMGEAELAALEAQVFAATNGRSAQRAMSDTEIDRIVYAQRKERAQRSNA